jgi:ABC-type amino acid transport substrate-binding protein
VIQTLNAEALKIAMPESFQPYTYKLQGEWAGIDVDIGRELHKRMGLEVKYEAMPWARQLAYTEKGLSAGILTVYCDDKKDFLALSSEPFYPIKISLFAHKDNVINQPPDSLINIRENAVLGLVRGNFYAAELEKHPHITLSYAHNTALLIEQLYSKRIDYVMEEYLPFMFHSKKRAYTDTFTEVMTYLEDGVCAAFSKPFFGDKTTTIVEQANEHIKALKAEGFIDRVIQKYSQ